MTRGTRSRPLWQVVLVATLLLLGANALVFFFFTLSRIDRSRRAEEQVGTLRQAVANARAEFERIKERADAIEANIRDARRFLHEMTRPIPEALATDLDAVEAAVRESRMRPERRGYVTQPVRDLPLVRYAMHLPLTGSRAQLATLLRHIERSPHFIVIERIAMRDDKDPGQSQVDVELSTYYQADAPATSGASSKRSSARAKTTRKP
jgi:hypothetical protein